MNAWMACHLVSRCQVVFMHVTKLDKEHICLRDIKVKSTNDIYVKARPKRMAADIFRDTATKAPCLACAQTSPLPQKKSGEETSVNRRR